MIRIIPQPQSIEETGGFCENTEKVNYITDLSLKSEAYKIDIHKENVIISASDAKGFHYGRITLRQIKDQYNGKLPCLKISDAPQFSYRGFMLDSARHMISVEEIKKLIDLAALLKMNKFHWHLSDDQGFRIELQSFPQLAKLGSVRNGDNFGSMCKSDKEYSGYYTKAQIKEIIDYCTERYIDVIPEIDMPGHSSAILHVFPHLSCRKEPVEVKTRQGIYKDNMCIGGSETFPFVKALFDEICEMFPYEYFHIGGDEAPDDYRRECPHCQKMIKENNLSSTAQLQCFFADNIRKYLETKGKEAIVWNDVLKGGCVHKDMIIQRWLDPKSNAFKAANSGNQIIISDFKPNYFDYPYGMYPLKQVYKFNPLGSKRLTEKGRKNILGVEAPLWTEFIDNNQRLEYMILPRWLAFVETGWTEQKNKSYNDFKSAAKNLLESLKKDGFSFAPESDWDMPLHKRLYDVIKFFKAFLSK